MHITLSLIYHDPKGGLYPQIEGALPALTGLFSGIAVRGSASDAELRFPFWPSRSERFKETHNCSQQRSDFPGIQHLGQHPADQPHPHPEFGRQRCWMGFQPGCGWGGNIDADPLFVDAQNDNLHLMEGSPAIDSGDDSSCPPTDLDGVPRPQGEGCDMGAYEFPIRVLFLPMVMRE